MPRPVIYVSESFAGNVTSTRHKRNSWLRISVEARDATNRNPVRVLVLRVSKEDGAVRPLVPELPHNAQPSGQDHVTSAAVHYDFPAKNLDCTQRIIILAWHKQAMIESPNPANVEVRHLALTFEG